MPSIKIDNQIFSLLQKHACPLVDNPNTVLRRLLKLAEVKSSLQKTEAALDERKKAPKADLAVLIRAGLLREGQKLYLVDHRGHKVRKHDALVRNSMLEFEGVHYTMSSIATALLQEVGYKSSSVRGPSHWATSKGITVTELWLQYVKSQDIKH